MDALKIERAVLGGYDWGGRAACIVAALLPSRVVALVSGNSYNIQSIADAMSGESGRGGDALVPVLLPQQAGPAGSEKNRQGDRAHLVAHVVAELGVRRRDFDRTASAFDNPDFVAIVIHSYRHRYGLAPGAGDPRYDEIEMGLAAQPPIAVPAITIDGDADGVNSGTAHHAKKFTGPHEHRIFKGAGHNLPQKRPEEWARAVIDARKMANA